MVGMSEIVHDLLLAGVPVDAMGAEGNTALHLASFHRQDGVVAVLMRGGNLGDRYSYQIVGWCFFPLRLPCCRANFSRNISANLYVHLRGAQWDN